MEAPITVISSNIRFDNPADGVNQWSKRKDHLAKTLLSQSPLIIGTQEGREPQLREMCKLLPGYSMIDFNREWLSERMYPCFFVKTDSVNVLDCGDIWLSETPHIPGSSSFDSAFPRLCTWLKVEINKTLWLFANVHLDHVKLSTRLAQVGVLGEEINKIKTTEKLIILGDFNDSPQSELRDHLLSHFPTLHDPWLGPEESSHHPFTGDHPDGSRIDWILVEGQFKNSEMKMLKDSHQGHWPSDHFPICCHIKA
ncbi:MAG: endonuclease/exonuclease/phosphatase family protein [Bacteriovoracia bacterium]